jgi:hypothetical protein
MSTFKHRYLAAAALALILAPLAGCATAPTPYQPYIAENGPGVHGGYSDQRLAPNRFVVKFHGNEFTSRERVEGYLLYRAAELTVQNGYDWFMMDDRRMEHEVQTYSYPTSGYRPFFGYSSWRPTWGYYRGGMGWSYWDPWLGDPFWADTVNTQTIEAFEASAQIAMNKGPLPPNDARAIDARTVMAELRTSVEQPKGQ